LFVLYAPGGIGRTLMYNTLELNCSGDVTAVRPSDGKARIELVTSTCTSRVVYYYMTVLITLIPSPS
jgi:hypothetical protein